MNIPQTPRCKAGSDSRTTAFVFTACLISLDMTGNNIDAIVRCLSASRHQNTDKSTDLSPEDIILCPRSIELFGQSGHLLG